jgi:macrolide transport system ATP-binding/permease protein
MKTGNWKIFMDFRYAIRMLLARPGFTAIALISLALGIGANTAVFSLVNQVLLKPLQIDHPEQVYSLYDKGPSSADFSAFSYPDYSDLRDNNGVFSGLVAYRFAPINLSHSGQNERIWGFLVSGNYFDVLGVKPRLGRTFAPEEDASPSTHPVAVISYGCWERRFASDAAVVGQTIALNGNTFTVIGVAPAGFNGTEVAFTPEIYVPVMMVAQIEPGRSWLTERSEGVLQLAARLKPGVTRAQAEAALIPTVDWLNQQQGHAHGREGIGRLALFPPGLFAPSLRGPAIAFAIFLMAVVGLVLLIACSNLAALLLARATERRREIAVRMAIGAGRFRLLRQLLTESILLSLLGGASGLLLSFWLVRLIAALRPPLDFPLSFDLHLDSRVLLFSLLVSILTGVVFGLAPAIQSTRLDLTNSLKDESRSGTAAGSRLQDLLVIGQVALSLILLVGTGLVLRSLQHARSINPGFDPEGAVQLSFDVGLQGYDKSRGLAFFEQAIRRTEALPGVRAASLVSIIPLSLDRSSTTIFVEGQTPSAGESYGSLQTHIWPGYFKTMGILLVDGRDLAYQDNKDSAQVAIVNETFARVYLGGAIPVSRRISRSSPSGPFLQIVGIAKDGKYLSIGETPRPMIYFPLLQSYESSVTLVARTSQDPISAVASIRSEIQQLDPTLPLYDAKPLSEQLGLSLFPARLAAVMLGAFGLLALILAAVGIYGIVSFASRRRIREIGIRVALGANRSRVVALIIRRAVILVAIGLTIGLAGALALTRFLSGILYGVSATDSLAFLSVGLLLALVAFVASWVPARQAAGTDPIVALRYE